MTGTRQTDSRRRCAIAAFAVVETLALLIAVPAFAGEFRWVEKSASQLELTENGRTVFVYNHGKGRECCYLHPLVSPGGVTLTDDGPADHPHHRGLFWAWPVVESGGQRYDSWLLKGIEHRSEGHSTSVMDSAGAHLKAAHSWVAGGRTVLRDTVAVTARPARGGVRMIEILLTLEATDGPVALAGAPEQNKGYGGLSARFAPRTGTVLRSSDGPVPKDEDHGAHRWAELEGTFAGGRAALRLTASPANPGAPNHWCLRHYGFAGANFPGVDPVRLEPGKPVTLRYEIRVADANAAAAAQARGNRRLFARRRRCGG
jgi:hypothetical protein